MYSLPDHTYTYIINNINWLENIAKEITIELYINLRINLINKQKWLSEILLT